ncbi:MAG TPA: Ig-like domain-containing protein, partial [Actinomycetota bacterium]
APGNDQLQLNKEAKPFPFVYIAASSRGTALRIDVNTGEILGEYRTAPENRSKNPSRTTVDKLGNVWVTNRDESERRTIDGVDTNWGSASRIGLLVGGTRVNADGAPNPTGEYVQPPFEYNTCVDRNGDGLIRTSRGRGHILRWQNTTGVDHDGGVETAEDECIQLYVRVRGINTRTVGIDANNDAWIGGANNWHEKVDGDTGQRVPGTAFDLNCGGYGGLVDRNGILWSARYGAGLLRYDTNTKTGVCLGNGHGDYGLGVDPVTGNIWHSALGGNWVVKLNPAATTASTIELARYRHGYNDAQGVAVDSKGSVWVAHALFSSTHVGRVATDGTFLGNAHLGGGHGSTGVSVDGNGKVWSANINSNSATRIDPEVGQKIAAGRPPSGWFDLNVDLGPGAGPYNYSDMTGSVSIGAASPSGFWSIKQDAGAAGTIWKRISWDGGTPEGTTIVTEVRAADSQTELPSRSFVEVTNGAPLAGVAGRYIEVRTTLQTSDGAVTPVLREIRVTANTPPVAQDLTAVTDRDTPVEIDLLATDEESDPLAYAIVAAPAHGTAELLGGNRVRYTPEPGYFGPDSFTYRASDDSADSNVATVTIDVVQTNVSPVAVDDVYTVHSGRTLTVDAPGVLGNDTDADGDALSFGGFGPVSDGTIAGSPDGSFTYTPPSGFTGSVTVAYLVLDGQGGEDSGTVTIHVVNSSPVAVDDEYTVHGSHELTVAAPGVLANDTDADGDTLRWAGFGPVSDGTISGNADGGFTYTPPAGFTGAVTVAYLVVDGHGGQDTGALTIRVVNSAPVAVDDEYTVHSGRTLTVEAPGLLENDTDADGDALSFGGFGPVSDGTIAGSPDGCFTYTPPSGFTGTVTVPYLVLDGNGGEDSGTLTIHVVNSSPVAADDEYTVRANRTLTVDPPGVLANDTDADGDPLVWGGFGPVGEGTISGSADGGFTYTPPDGFTGTVTVPYLVLDGN